MFESKERKETLFVRPKPFNIVLAKKNYIKQIDILINLFDKFSIEYEEKVKDKENQNNGNIQNISEDAI